LRKRFGTVNHYLQHDTATPSNQLLGPFEKETERLLVWHGMLHVLEIASIEVEAASTGWPTLL